MAPKIADIATLKDQMQEAVLVSLDLEGSPYVISEIALATIAVRPGIPHFCEGRARFFDRNKVRAVTWEVYAKPQANYENYRHRETIECRDEDVAAVCLVDKVRDLAAAKMNLLLVGYDLQMELRWISRHCPRLTSYLAATVDVQDLIMQSLPKDTKQIRLTKALAAFSIKDNRHCASYHSATNDAVRSLAVLAALLETRLSPFHRRQRIP